MHPCHMATLIPAANSVLLLGTVLLLRLGGSKLIDEPVCATRSDGEPLRTSCRNGGGKMELALTTRPRLAGQMPFP
eukprot:scaffold81269_cov36-Tisochrysis_lutea.AAC.2